MLKRVWVYLLKDEVLVGFCVDVSQFFDAADHQGRHRYHAELFVSGALPCC